MSDVKLMIEASLVLAELLAGLVVLIQKAGDLTDEEKHGYLVRVLAIHNTIQESK